MSLHHLVVGAHGQIGAALLARLSEERVPAIGTAHRNLSPSLCYLDLSCLETQVLDQQDYVVAYLTAGVCRLAACESDPTTSRLINIDGMRALVQYLASRGVFVVFLSTNQVFDGRQPFASPAMSCAPQNEYGRQKAEMESIIQSHCKRFAILRLSKVVPPGMALIQQWVQALKARQPVTVFSDMILAPVTMRQVVETLILLGETQQTGIYHLSGAEDLSYYELAQYLALYLGVPLSLVQAESALTRGFPKHFLPLFTTLDCSSTMALSKQRPPDLKTVLKESFIL